jgi:exonuclease SbcD
MKIRHGMLLKTPVWFHELTLKRYFFCNPGFKTNHESHDGIIYIIQIVTKDGNAEQQTKVNLTRIFRDYSRIILYQHKQGAQR